MTSIVKKLSAFALAAATVTTISILSCGSASANGAGKQPGGIAGVGVRPVVGGSLPSGAGRPPGHGGLGPVSPTPPPASSNPGRGPIIVDPCFTCIGHGHDGDRDHDHRHWGHRWGFGFPEVIETERLPDACVFEYKWRTRYVPGFGLERARVKVCVDI